MSNGFNSGDVIIDTFNINGINLTPNILTATVRESMLRAVAGTSVSIEIIDTLDNYSNIKAGDTAFFSFKAPGTPSNTYSLLVHSKKEIKDPGTNTLKSKKYVIHCISPATFFASVGRIQKKWNTNLENVVKEVFNEYMLKMGSKGIARTSSSKQSYEMWASNHIPGELINMCLNRIVSANGGAWCWFENRNGFNFITWDDAFRGFVTKTLRQTNSIGHDFRQATHDVILKYDIEKKGDISKALYSGMIKRIGYDARTKDKNIKDHQLDVSSFIGSALQGALQGAVTGVLRIPHVSLIGDMANRNMTYSKEFSKTSETIAKLLQNKIYIWVPGDPMLTVGENIICNVPKKISTTGTAGNEDDISGKSLVVGLQHNIGLPNSQPRYVCQIEAIKDTNIV